MQQKTNNRKVMRNKKRGMVYVFSGNGKGKTSAAIGVGVRAALSGMKVAMVCWYKSKDWDVSEYQISKKLKNFQVYPMGEGFRIKESSIKYKVSRGKYAPLKGGGAVVDKASEEEHRIAAKHAMGMAKKLIGNVDVLILDEVNNAVKDGLVNLKDLIKFISNRGKTHLLLTGRDMNKNIVEIADLVTEMRKVKHPYDKGVKAVKGLDF